MRSVIVRQESSQAGVAADVYKLDSSNRQQFLVTVGGNGRATVDERCATGDRFTAAPKVQAYLQVTPLPCSTTLDFELPNAQTSYALVIKGDAAMKVGDFGQAQAYYGLAAARFAYSQPGKSQQLRSEAIEAAGRALKVATPTVLIDQQNKPTVETQTKIKEFQVKWGLPQTGELDSLTSKKLSGLDTGEVLRRAKEVPANEIPATNAK